MPLVPASITAFSAGVVVLLAGCGGAGPTSNADLSVVPSAADGSAAAVDASGGTTAQDGSSDSNVADDGGTAPSGPTVTLETFDPKCDGSDPTYNCRAAFQRAFAALAKAGGGTLQLPAGTFLIEAPEVPVNVTSAAALAPTSLIRVPANTTIQGTVAGTAYSSTIRWTNSSIPLFVFDGANDSGMKNLHVQYAGVLPANVNGYPYGDIALLTALGYKPTFPHDNQMQGTKSEVFTAVYVFNSSGCSFDHLLFDSAIADNDHIFGFGINLKGSGVVTTDGNGGLGALATGNRLTNLEFHDEDMAMLVSGQDKLVVSGITANNRGSSTAFGPGHVLYLTGQFTFFANGTSTCSYDTNVTVENITEGPDIFSNVYNSATLAPKYTTGATFDHITSQHPAGLIATIYADQNITFTNMTWSSSVGFCEETPTPELCGIDQINSTATDAGSPLHATQNLKFDGLTMSSTKDPVLIGLTGDNLVVNNVTITGPAEARAGVTNAGAVLGIVSTSKATITNYTYEPLLTAYSTSAVYNIPFFGFGNAITDATASVQIDLPASVSVPAGSNIIRAGFQYPAASDVATATVSP